MSCGKAAPQQNGGASAYEIGGPLAGVPLPLFKNGQRGNGAAYGEFDLYPGSVEHWRAYWLKYCPVRSFFDRQSQLHNWVVPAIPGAENKPLEKFAAPIYQLYRDSTGTPTGQYQPPVAAVRCTIGDPVFKLDLGELNPGVYTVRVIAAVETSKLRPFREPEYLKFTVNDGINNEATNYRVRIGYTDDFYSVAELYFHAPERRAYHAELTVDQGSKIDLLVHNISLDDVLVGTTRRAVKTRATLFTSAMLADMKANADPKLVQQLGAEKPLTPEQRLATDASIWNSLPPDNSQGGWLNLPVPEGVEQGVADKTLAQIEAEYGKWEPGDDDFMVNKKLNLKYTWADYYAHKTLPDPYPYKDDGAGLFFPDPQNPKKGRVFSPIANAISWRYYYGQGLPHLLQYNGELFLKTGNPDRGRTAAIALIRYAYAFPSLDSANWFHEIEAAPGWLGMDNRFRQRDEQEQWTGQYGGDPGALSWYDRLFDYIKGNEELARSVHRFVPWVNTSQDVIQLLDTYLVQMQARRVMRYHDYSDPSLIIHCATIQGDTSVTDPWMDWAFSRDFIYPQHPEGLQDLLITGNDREGPRTIGSQGYSGQGAKEGIDALQAYLASGGNQKYNLADPVRYPKTMSHYYWFINSLAGGSDGLRIGDVTGPDKSPGRSISDLINVSTDGWHWSHDPKFAWLLVNGNKRTTQTDAEWNEIVTAAAAVKRAPYLDNHSRALSNWAGILETGLQHDDYRFRRAVYVRTGLGLGHQHEDELDLQVFAHGLPMTVDGGQRSGYSKPNDKYGRIHNTVEVDGRGNDPTGQRSHGWTRALSDAPGARYMETTAIPPPNATLYQRQTALIDVDEGNGSKPLTAAQQLLIGAPKPEPLPAGVTTANSYVFDVFRVAGGNLHTYCFHGPVNDGFEINTRNASAVANAPENVKFDTDANYLSLFGDSSDKKAGDGAETLEATWRYKLEGIGGEKQMLGNNYAEGPRHFTHLSLLDTELHVLQAPLTSTKYGYKFDCIMAQKRGENLQSAFPAIIESYAGEPFLTSTKLLPVSDNETDAQRAVAVEITTRNGHDDVCFADGKPDKVREFRTSNSTLRISGEFAYLSNDAQGLRQVSLTGGTLLVAPNIHISTTARERAGKVTTVDYPAKSFLVDAPFSTASAGREFEIGNPQHTTGYMLANVAPQANSARLTVTRGADYYRSRIEEIDAENKTVKCALGFSLDHLDGLSSGLVASNDQMTKFWHVDRKEGEFVFDGSIAEADFAPTNVLRLWEYGPGDTVRQSTFVSLRRTEGNVYEVTGDVDTSLAFKGSKIEFSPNGQAWRALQGERDGDWVKVKIGLAQLSTQPVYIRFMP